MFFSSEIKMLYVLKTEPFADLRTWDIRNNEHTMGKNPNWQEATSCIFTSVVEPELIELEPTMNNTSWWSERDLLELYIKYYDKAKT